MVLWCNKSVFSEFVDSRFSKYLQLILFFLSFLSNFIRFHFLFIQTCKHVTLSFICISRYNNCCLPWIKQGKTSCHLYCKFVSSCKCRENQWEHCKEINCYEICMFMQNSIPCYRIITGVHILFMGYNWHILSAKQPLINFWKWSYLGG